MKPAAGRGMKGLPAQAPSARCLGHRLTHNSHRQGHLVAFFCHADLADGRNGAMSVYEDALAAFRSGATSEAASIAEDLVRTSRASEDVSGEIDGLCMLARVALRQGDLKRVAMLAGEGRALALRKKEPRLERMPLHLEAVAARMQGDFETARQLDRKSVV